MKKLIVILLALSLVLPAFSATAQEGDEGYGLYVGGMEVTPDNENDLFGDGTASYNPESKTLALKGALITGGAGVPDGSGDYMLVSVYAKNNLKINVSDTCTIACLSSERANAGWYGIRCEGKLTIRGSSADSSTLKVVVYGTDGKLQISSACGIWCGDSLEVNSVYVESGCMDAAEGFEESRQCGIFCKGMLKPTDAIVVGYTADQSLGSGTAGVDIHTLEFDRAAIVGISGNNGLAFNGMLTPDEYQNMAYVGLFSSVESGNNYDGSGTKADQLANFTNSGYSRKYVVIKPQSN